jgi:hypothetical protein
MDEEKELSYTQDFENEKNEIIDCLKLKYTYFMTYLLMHFYSLKGD